MKTLLHFLFYSMIRSKFFYMSNLSLVFQLNLKKSNVWRKIAIDCWPTFYWWLRAKNWSNTKCFQSTSGRPKLQFRQQFRPKLPVSAKFRFRPKPKKVSAETFSSKQHCFETKFLCKGHNFFFKFFKCDDCLFYFF